MSNIDEKIRLHQLWLAKDPSGVRADFSSHNLDGVDFKKSNLSHANFNEASLIDADLRDCILHHATFAGASMKGVVAHSADMSHCDFSYANLSNSFMSDVFLMGSDLSNAEAYDSYWPMADLSWANLRECDLSFADLSEANLTGADLRDASLNHLALDCGRIEFADCEGADMTGATLFDVDLHRSNMSNVKGFVYPIADRGLATKAYEAIINHPESYDQSVWHSECGAKHCAAGWVVALAGDHGTHLEQQRGTGQAAADLLGVRLETCPWGPDDDPLPWLAKIGRT